MTREPMSAQQLVSDLEFLLHVVHKYKSKCVIILHHFTFNLDPYIYVCKHHRVGFERNPSCLLAV